MQDKAARKPGELLDGEELVHLAMRAINAGQHPQAMAMLKQAVQQEPENGVATYLLAAEHAQAGMFDRAMAGMEKALALAPDLEVARLQLGLMYTARDRLGDARPLYERLESLPAEDALHWFGKGLGALIDERVEDCRAALEKGIGLNRTNPALNGDMQRVLAQLDAVAGQDEKASAGRPVDEVQNNVGSEKKKCCITVQRSLCPDLRIMHIMLNRGITRAWRFCRRPVRLSVLRKLTSLSATT